MAKTKICFLAHSLSAGGKERVMSELAWHFAEKDDIDLHLIIYGNEREIFYSLPGRITIHKPIFEFSNKQRIRSTLRTIRFLRKGIKTIRPDSILNFGEYWNGFIILVLLGIKCRIYISDRSQPGKDLGVVHNTIRSLFYKRASGYIAQTSEAEAVAKSRRWNNNIKVIPNPISETSFQEATRREKIILSVGRYIPTKNFDQLIRLFAEIDDPDWKLVIVGGEKKPGGIHEKLTLLIKKYGAERNIILEGVKSNVNEYYRQSSIFAFMSSSEGFPNVLLEALSAGLPVISYDCNAGPRDIIVDGQNGFLIPLSEEGNFKNKLETMMKDEAVLNGLARNAMNSVKGFSMEAIGKDYYDFLLANECD